jgi:hypothetical protein
MAGDSETPGSSGTSGASSALRIVRAAVGLAVVIGALAFVWWLGPAILTRHPSSDLSDAARLKAANDVRTALVGTLVGLAAIATVAFAAINARVNQRSLQATLDANRASQEAQQESHRIERESQVTDLYTKAIDQLGQRDSLSVRLGGIFALARISEDSARDRETVIDILSAFVREHADKRSLAELDFTKQDDFTRQSPLDVVAAMQAIGRLPREAPPGRGLRPVDLRRIRLQGADLQGAELRAVRLNGAELVQCDLHEVDLREARLSDADVRYSNLKNADLSGAFLDDANLLNVDFTGARIAGAKLHGARYRDHQFSEEQLAAAFTGD